MRILSTPAVVCGLVAALVAATFVSAAHAADKSPKKERPKKPHPLITISKETTYLTEPLTEDGYVDYVKALNDRISKGVTPENNAAVLFWKALGPKPIDKAIRREFFEKLGIPCPSEEGEYFVTIRDFAKKELGAKDDGGDAPDVDWLDTAHDQQDRAMDAPWNAEQYPVIANWLKANEKPLGLIIEGTRRTRYYCPLVGEEDPPMLIAVLLPGLSEIREPARALRARAMLELGSGNVDAAWQDLLACHRLARLIGQGPTIVDALVSIAIDGIACEADQLLAYHAKPSAKQATAMCAALRKLPPLPKMFEKLDQAERFMGLDSVAYLARQGPSTLQQLQGAGGGQIPLSRAIVDAVAKRLIDWDEILRMMNRWYDRIVDAMSKPDRAERDAAMKRFEEELNKRVAAAKDPARLAGSILLAPSLNKVLSRQIGNIMLALLMPALQTVAQVEDRAEMTADLTAVSLALAAYRAEHGTYPDRLAPLAPQYIPEVPEDLFADGPLRYRREAKGYLVYSVGPNGKDNGGHTRQDVFDDPTVDTEADDIVIRVPPAENN